MSSAVHATPIASQAVSLAPLWSAALIAVQAPWRRLQLAPPCGLAEDRNKPCSPIRSARGASESVPAAGAYADPDLDFEPAAPYRFTDNALHAGVGHRVMVLPRVALRVEGRAVYAPATQSPFSSAWAGHLVGIVGLSVFAGGGRHRDRDGDGVMDRRDACPRTPLGAAADPHGCPADSDGDGADNGLDACPRTPAGTPTDRPGCLLDADRDGVHDVADRCAETPSGAPVDPRGCPADADEDGVPDGRDRCHGPLGALVDAGGCPVDSDADGLPDGLDRCPDTRPSAAVDAVGCPLARDSDGDGVDDPLDRCPRTAAGTSVDANGCPPLFRGERAPLVLHGVTFEAGRSALQHEAFAILNQVATSLAANPEVRVEIAGHTDNAGGARSNQVLSQARADAVRAYLARRGVSPARMVSRGYGETQPVASNATPEGRAENRRVELRELR
jgi:outer membrane protein OmpA-like peptidoglycan-associated protein